MSERKGMREIVATGGSQRHCGGFARLTVWIEGRDDDALVVESGVGSDRLPLALRDAALAGARDRAQARELRGVHVLIVDVAPIHPVDGHERAFYWAGERAIDAWIDG